jgi:hypothetical protein
MTEQSMQRKLAFKKLRLSIHDQYDLNYDQRGSEYLIVVFSPNPRATLRKYPFAHDCLYVADRRLQYYTRNPGRQTMVLHGFIQRCGYKKIAFIGSSKGGAGALLWSSLISKWDRSFDLFCLAFSPQTLLFPFNENLVSLPSYVNNMRALEGDSGTKANFEAYGDIPKVLAAHAAPTLVAYSAKNRMDSVEAERLAGIENVRLNPINLAFHGSITPFVINLGNTQEVDKLAAKLYADAEHDADLRAMLPVDRGDFSTIFNGLDCPSLSDQIDRFCNMSAATEDKLEVVVSERSA